MISNSKFQILNGLMLTSGPTGGLVAGKLIILPLVVATGFIYGLFTLQLEIIAMSILGFVVAGFVSIPTFRRLFELRRARLKAYEKIITELDSYKPYNNLYRFEAPRHYEIVEEARYLSDLKKFMLMGLQAELKHVASSNNVVVSSFFADMRPKMDGLDYVS